MILLQRDELDTKVNERNKIRENWTPMLDRLAGFCRGFHQSNLFIYIWMCCIIMYMF